MEETPTVQEGAGDTAVAVDLETPRATGGQESQHRQDPSHGLWQERSSPPIPLNWYQRWQWPGGCCPGQQLSLNSQSPPCLLHYCRRRFLFAAMRRHFATRDATWGSLATGISTNDQLHHVATPLTSAGSADPAAVPELMAHMSAVVCMHQEFWELTWWTYNDELDVRRQSPEIGNGPS